MEPAEEEPVHHHRWPSVFVFDRIKGPIHDYSPDGEMLPPNRDVMVALKEWDGKVNMAPQPAGRKSSAKAMINFSLDTNQLYIPASSVARVSRLLFSWNLNVDLGGYRVNVLGKGFPKAWDWQHNKGWRLGGKRRCLQQPVLGPVGPDYGHRF